MSNHIYHQNYSYLVYMHTSTISGKSYIGYTSKTMEERFKGHVSEMRYGSTYAFHNALRKYGKENFISEMLYVCDNLEDASSAEIQLIETYDTWHNGYNENRGGQNPPIKSGKNHYKSKFLIIDNIKYDSLTDANIKLKTYSSVLLEYIENFKDKISFVEFQSIKSSKRKYYPITINGIEYIHEANARKALGISFEALRAFKSSGVKDINEFLSMYDTRKCSITINSVKYKSKRDAMRSLNLTNTELRRLL